MPAARTVEDYLEDLPLEVIAAIVGGTSLDAYVARIAAGQRRQAARKTTKRPAARAAAGASSRKKSTERRGRSRRVSSD